VAQHQRGVCSVTASIRAAVSRLQRVQSSQRGRICALIQKLCVVVALLAGAISGLCPYLTQSLSNRCGQSIAPLTGDLPCLCSCLCVYGGVPKPPQVKALRGGIDIVVGTPGRLEDLMGDGSCRLNVSPALRCPAVHLHRAQRSAAQRSTSQHSAAQRRTHQRTAATARLHAELRCVQHLPARAAAMQLCSASPCPHARATVLHTCTSYPSAQAVRMPQSLLPWGLGLGWTTCPPFPILPEAATVLGTNR
jgi:hypothetical protein